jgi:hypothetical protein
MNKSRPLLKMAKENQPAKRKDKQRQLLKKYKKRYEM